MPTLPAPNRAARGLHALYDTVLNIDAGDFAILDDIDAKFIRRAGIAPGHRIMPRRAAAPLHQRALHGKARVLVVEIRDFAAQLRAVKQFGIHPVQPHRIAAPRKSVTLGIVMVDVENTALARPSHCN